MKPNYWASLLIGCQILLGGMGSAATAGDHNATLIVRNETDATLTITVFNHGWGTELIPPVQPGKTAIFSDQLPQGGHIAVEAAPRCVREVGGVSKPLVVTGAGRYELTFQAADFGKSLLLDGPGCGADGLPLPKGDCYAENRDIDFTGTGGRALGGSMIADDGEMTVEKCMAHCSAQNFPYAGLQYGRWCFCGNSPGTKIDAAACSMPCSGNVAQTCGGPWANSVYGLKQHPAPPADAPPAPPPPAGRECPGGYNPYGCL